MGEIMAAKAAALFEEILGWPYRLGGDGSGTNRDIDCSGAWVRVYKKHGLSLYHGSNAQYRRYCSETGRITGPGDLQVGMAVYKCKPWSDDQRGHREYGKAPGNLYHVGCVTSVNPLRIVHATPPVAKVDTAVGKWAYWGRMKEVDYMSETKPDDIKVLWVGIVSTERDPLRVRASAPDGAIVGHAPRGAQVEVLDITALEGWVFGRYKDVSGYMSRQYIARDGEPEPVPALSGHVVKITALEGAPLTALQASNLAEELRVAGYDVDIYMG